MMAKKKFLSMETVNKKLAEKLQEVASSRELLHSILGDLIQAACDYDSGAITRKAMKTAVEQAIEDKKMDMINLAADVNQSVAEEEEDKETDKDNKDHKKDDGDGDGVGTAR